MSETASVTEASAFKQGSLALQLVLAVVTLGLYTLYWGYSTASQLNNGTNRSLTPVLALVPIVNIVSFWQISDAAEAVTSQSKIVLFILFMFFPPLSWFWVQSGINNTAAN